MPRLPPRLFLATVVVAGTLPLARVGAQSISAQSPGAGETPVTVLRAGRSRPACWPT